jgi:hypothetical protein
MAHLLEFDRSRVRFTPRGCKVTTGGRVRQTLCACARQPLEERIRLGVESLKLGAEMRAAPSGGPCHWV